MGKNTGHILTFKEDPEDARRVDELETNYQPRSHRLFTSVPDTKQVKDNEPFIQNDDGTIYWCVRIGNKIYRKEMTEVT